MTTATIEFRNAVDVQQRLASAPDTIKRRVLKRVVNDIIRMNKQRTLRQVDVDGVPFQKHKRLRKRKMLTRLSRRLKVTNVFAEGILIGFERRVDEVIGAKHQYGISTPGNSAGNNLRPVNADDPASRDLAKELLKEGFKVRIAGKAAKKPTIKWITENIKTGRGFLILKLLRSKNGTDGALRRGMPPRSILGISANDFSFLTAIALAEAEAALAQT